MMRVIGHIGGQTTVREAHEFYQAAAVAAGVDDPIGSVAVLPSGEIVATDRAVQKLRELSLTTLAGLRQQVA